MFNGGPSGWFYLDEVREYKKKERIESPSQFFKRKLGRNLNIVLIKRENMEEISKKLVRMVFDSEFR